MCEPVIGRFAPTPSGRLHLGNILCAMLAYLSARSQGGRFLLRIEDVDVPRCPPALAAQAVDDLRWLGFDWDEEPLYQHERTNIYQQHLDRLEGQGLLYPCFCTRAQLANLLAPNAGDTQIVYPGTCRGLSQAQRDELALRRSPSIRLHVPDECVSFMDGLYGLQTENLARDCGDFVLKRSDGLFGYQLAAVVDDALCGVTEVVRGRDIMSSTPRQIFLLRQLGYPLPRYVHIPLLTDAHGRRLAKRDRDLDLTALRQRYTPQQLLGTLAACVGLLPRPQSISLAQLCNDFSWEKIKKEDVRLFLPDFFHKEG